MRKLVKKLALVLALVLAIGCIAPASAQAAEGVRRSWNFAPGEYKPTKTMTVDDAYTFELLDMGASIDTSIYDVAYWSKGDALEMSTSTGYAVAKAAAEDVKIVAVVTNKVTGNSVKVWAFVDIAAKEVVATATPTATVAPTEAPLALVSAEQTATNQLVLTFNKDVTKTFKKADLSVKYSKTEDGKAKYNCYIKGTPVVDGNKVTVELYTSIKADAYVFATYANCGTQSFKASSGKVAALEVLTTAMVVDPDENEAPIEIALYDENGIRLNVLKTTDDLPDNVEIEVTLLENVVNGEEIAETDGTGVVFYKMGETVCAVVNYIIEDEDGNKTPVEGYGEITSIDTKPIISKVQWSATTKKYYEFSGASYGANKVYLGESNWKLAGKLELILPAADGNDKKVTAYTENVAKIDNRYEIEDIDLANLVYESSDTSVLLVDADGGIIPINEGTAEIIVSFPDYEDEETDEMVEGEIIGVHEVTVYAKREIVRISATIQTEKISNGPKAHERAEVRVYAYDQYGSEYDVNADLAKKMAIEPENKESEAIMDDFVSGITEVSGTGSNKNQAVFYIYGYNDFISDDPDTENVDERALPADTYTYKVSFGDFVTGKVKLKVSNVPADAEIKCIDLTGTAKKDVKVQKGSSMTKTVELVVKAFDSSVSSSKDLIKTLFVENTRMSVEKKAQEDAEKEAKADGLEYEWTTVDGSLWYDVTLPKSVDADKFWTTGKERVKVVSVTGPEKDKPEEKYWKTYTTQKIVFTPYEIGAEQGTDYPEGLPVGDYVFTLYEYDAKSNKFEDISTATVTITNGQETLTSKIEKITIDESFKDVMAGITIGSNGAFKATTTTGSALIDALVKDHYDSEEDAEYCVSLWDGKTEIVDCENGPLTVWVDSFGKPILKDGKEQYVSAFYEVVEVEGFATGNKITVKTITVEKTYNNGKKVLLEVSVNAGLTCVEED